MKNEDNRIFFINNPYPLGHKIERFRWVAEIIPSLGILFHFELESEDYNSGMEAQAPEILMEEYQSTGKPNFDYFWETNHIWLIYKRCLISSLYKTDCYEYDGGILVGSKSKKIDFTKLENMVIEADTLEENGLFDFRKKMAFKSNVNSSDCADHKIHIMNQQNNQFDIDWTGKIALQVTGNAPPEFCYKFKARITNIKFEGLYYPENLTNQELKKLLSDFSIKYDSIILKRGKINKIKKSW